MSDAKQPQTSADWPEYQCLHTLKGHNAPVTSVDVSPDGAVAVSASRDGILRIWNLAHGECMHTLQGHTGTLLKVRVTPDGHCAVSIGWDAVLKVWDLVTGACLRTLKESCGVLDLCLMPDGRHAVTGSGEHFAVNIHDLETGKRIRSLEGHEDWVTSVCITPDGSHIISACGYGLAGHQRGFDQTIRVWDTGAGSARVLTAGSCIHSLCATGEGWHAISKGGEQVLRVWDLVTGDCVNTIELGELEISVLCAIPGTSRFLSGNHDGTVGFWDAEKKDCQGWLQAHAQWVTGVSVTPDGRCMITGGWDQCVRVWR